MNIEIIPSNFKPLNYGWEILTEKDFNNVESFFDCHPNIKPESIQEIEIRGLLEIHPFPHVLLRHCDWMLKVGGKISIETISVVDPTYIIAWSYCQLRALMSICLRCHFVCTYASSYDLACPNQRLVFEKNKTSLPCEDSIEKWTFGICSNGRANHRVRTLIQTIAEQKIPHFEVIVCGSSPYDREECPSYVRIINDSSIYDDKDVRFPIGKKKMLIAENARYNNLFILHDRFSFPVNWYCKMKQYGNYYDVMTPVVQTCDGKRIMPSISLRNPSISLRTSAELIKYLRKISIGVPFLYQDNIMGRLYINGGSFMVKRHIYLSCPIPTHLHWGEVEDQVWGDLLRLNGYLISVDNCNYIYSDTVRFSGVDSKFTNKESRIKKLLYDLYQNCSIYRDCKHVARMYEDLYGVSYKNFNHVKFQLVGVIADFCLSLFRSYRKIFPKK